MPFCTNCGRQFPDGTKFCPECGTPVAGAQPQNPKKRTQSFEGEIRKCPNCGELLSAFELKCHACGFELRNAKASTAVQEFYNKIEQIEEGRDKRKPGETEKSIANVIRNYPIPNTKEDVLEFMMLAASNIDTSLYSVHGNQKKSEAYQSQKLVADAWCATAEQVYHKAELSFGDDPAFSKIQGIYANKIAHIASAKRQGAVKGVLDAISSPFKGINSGLKKNKEWSFLIIWLLVMLGCMAVPIIGLSGDKREHSNKEKQLEAIVVEIQECIANEDYDTAMIKAQCLYMDDNYSSESTERWDKVRENLIDMIETKSGVSYTSNTASSNKDKPPTSNSNEEESSSPSIKDVVKGTKEVLSDSVDIVKDTFGEIISGIFE